MVPGDERALLPLGVALSRSWVPMVRLAGAVAGMAFVLWLVYAELFVVRAICLWCTVVHVLAFALFVIVVLYGAETAEDP